MRIVLLPLVVLLLYFTRAAGDVCRLSRNQNRTVTEFHAFAFHYSPDFDSIVAPLRWASPLSGCRPPDHANAYDQHIVMVREQQGCSPYTACLHAQRAGAKAGLIVDNYRIAGSNVHSMADVGRGLTIPCLTISAHDVPGPYDTDWGILDLRVSTSNQWHDAARSWWFVSFFYVGVGVCASCAFALATIRVVSKIQRVRRFGTSESRKALWNTSTLVQTLEMCSNAVRIVHVCARFEIGYYPRVFPVTFYTASFTFTTCSLILMVCTVHASVLLVKPLRSRVFKYTYSCLCVLLVLMDAAVAILRAHYWSVPSMSRFQGILIGVCRFVVATLMCVELMRLSRLVGAPTISSVQPLGVHRLRSVVLTRIWKWFRVILGLSVATLLTFSGSMFVWISHPVGFHANMIAMHWLGCLTSIGLAFLFRPDGAPSSPRSTDTPG